MPFLDDDAGEEDGNRDLDEHHSQDVRGFSNVGKLQWLAELEREAYEWHYLHQPFQVLKVSYDGATAVRSNEKDCCTV